MSDSLLKRLKVWGSVAGVIVVTAGAIAAWQQMGLPWFASKSYAETTRLMFLGSWQSDLIAGITRYEGNIRVMREEGRMTPEIEQIMRETLAKQNLQLANVYEQIERLKQ